MSAFVLARIATWPLLLRSIVLPVVLLSLMTYVVMPVVTKALRGLALPAKGCGSREPIGRVIIGPDEEPQRCVVSEVSVPSASASMRCVRLCAAAAPASAFSLLSVL